MITEDFVSFETARLLKEKGFNEKVICYYNVVIKDMAVAYLLRQLSKWFASGCA